MQTDETGAPWPYEKLETREKLPPGEPTWECPEGICVCHPREQPLEPVQHNITFFDEQARRMPGARCRVLENGKLINLGSPYADGEGSVLVRIQPTTKTLELEWAPYDTPRQGRYPHRKLYYVDMGQDQDDRVQRRLANIGFSLYETLERNVEDFKEAYVAEPEPHNGRAEEIYPYLTAFNDGAALPPRGTKVPPAPTGAPAPPGGGSGLSLAGLPTSQGPAATPAPRAGRTAQGVATPVDYYEVVIDWGERAQTFLAGWSDRPQLFPANPPRPTGAREPGPRSSSFWINVKSPRELPVTIGLVSATRDFGAAHMTKLPLRQTTATSATVRVPTSYPLVRLDFDLKVTIGPHSKSVLAFQQLYYIDPTNGEWAPTGYSINDYVFRKGPLGVPPSREDMGSRTGPGLHPLIWHEPLRPADIEKALSGKPVTLRRIAINTEFVDATELWWAVHDHEDSVRFLHPGLNPRPEHLRVLAWTVGGVPMIWFVAIPDAAIRPGSEGGANIVFFRPPPDDNSFPYTPDAAGFSKARHESTTMWILARYLLPSQSLAALVNAGVTDPDTQRAFASQLQPYRPKSTPTEPADPPDPMTLADALPDVFRPVGLQTAVNALPVPHLLVLPLGFDAFGKNDTGGYASLRLHGGLRDKMSTVFVLLWNTGAVARGTPRPPAPGNRDLWLAGHSAGNRSMCMCLERNAEDVSRVMSFSPTPKAANFDANLPRFTAASAKRKKANLPPLDLILTSAPDLTKTFEGEVPGQVQGISLDRKSYQALQRTGAAITAIPAPDVEGQKEYYTISPKSGMNPYLRHLLGQWTDDQIALSAKHPHHWEWLFFHEYGMFGGFGNPDEGPSAYRSFFSQALGPPDPH